MSNFKHYLKKAQALNENYLSIFPGTTLPPNMPRGYEDVSWRNDLCASFRKDLGKDGENGYITIFIAQDKPEDRDGDVFAKYYIALRDKDEEIIDGFETDDFEKILRKEREWSRIVDPEPNLFDD